MTLTIPDEYVDWRTKGLWLPESRLRSSEFVAAKPDVFTGPFAWPLMLLKQDAVAHNVTTMAEYTARHGLAFAPHGKTSMAPRLFEMQLDAGAWGITLATAGQVLAARGFGVPRIFLANELLDPLALRWVVAEGERDPDFEFVCYLDSVEGVEAIRSALSEVEGERALSVVVELGHPGGRTGVRTVDEAVELARTAARVDRLAVRGIAGYEGGLRTVDEAADYLGRVRDAAVRAADAGAVTGKLLVSAGGSAYFDTVTEVLGGDWAPAHDVLLRSGAYVTHDHGFYRDHTPFNRTGEATLEPAFELWARVLSVPEDGLALCGAGKRDLPFDEGLPVPLRVQRADGSEADATAGRVTKLMDQHCYLTTDGLPPLRPGDLVAFGISHPCTAFDKWRVLPMVDPEYRVVELIHTYF